MNTRKDDIINESDNVEKQKRDFEKKDTEKKEEQQKEIIQEGDRAERLKENADFLYFMEKLIKRADEITTAQVTRLINIRKLTEVGKNTIDSIVANQLQEAVLGGEFLGLIQMANNVKMAIKNKEQILGQLREEENEEDDE